MMSYSRWFSQNGLDQQINYTYSLEAKGGGKSHLLAYALKRDPRCTAAASAAKFSLRVSMRYQRRRPVGLAAGVKIQIY